VKVVCDETRPADPNQNLLSENERLRRENRILRVRARSENSPGDLFFRRMEGTAKKGHTVLRGPKAVKFAFLDGYRGTLFLGACLPRDGGH